MKRRSFLKRALVVTGLTMTGGRSLRGSVAESNDPLASRAVRPLCLPKYTRMFPQLSAGTHSEEGLKKLGTEGMKDDAEGNSAITAGYTYFGQFIDHDVTLDLTPLDEATPDVTRTQNFRTPFLDLDHVYGGGPHLSPFLYDRAGVPDEERFLIGETSSALGDPPSSHNDLPRNSQGRALVGDARQDENLILAQLHVAFLKFHNLILDGLKNKTIKSVGPPKGSWFAQAQRLVQWHYQWIVRYDFLGDLVIPEILNDIWQKRPAQPSSQPFEIPVEFSAAAFRFGHSMVRDEYAINEFHQNVKLHELFERTGLNGAALPVLPADWVIQWRRFFRLLGGPMTETMGARRINTKIAEGLRALPTNLMRAFNLGPKVQSNRASTDPPQLPVRTLLRGRRMGLPSGQDIATALPNTVPLMPAQLLTGLDALILQQYGFHESTPLWYYILKEAELSTEAGSRLGRVGSYIVSQVLVDALTNDLNSYVNVAPNWKPTKPLASADPNAQGADLFNLPYLLKFVTEN